MYIVLLIDVSLSALCLTLNDTQFKKQNGVIDVEKSFNKKSYLCQRCRRTLRPPVHTGISDVFFADYFCRVSLSSFLSDIVDIL